MIKKQVRPWRLHIQRHGDRWNGYDNNIEIHADTKSTRLVILWTKSKNWKAFGETNKQTDTDWQRLIQIEKAKNWETIKRKPKRAETNWERLGLFRQSERSARLRRADKLKQTEVKKGWDKLAAGTDLHLVCEEGEVTKVGWVFQTNWVVFT